MEDGGDIPGLDPESDDMPPVNGEPVEGDNSKGDNEIDDIFGKLDIEKQAAVIKYAKSMMNGDEPQNPEPEPQMESYVNEIVNNILSDIEDDDIEERKCKGIRNEKVTTANPFVSARN